MKRNISLYIGDSLVDLDDSSFILFNFTFEDLSNPTIVKNSWSQQLTLPGTDNNNRIFGQYFRPDRRVGSGSGVTGADFNPLRKTPFTIYSDTNEVLQSGYVKLESVSRRGRSVISWSVTLYGGLGGYFYSLSYDDEGNKLILADLDYLGTSNPDEELTFAITANAVSEAWAADSDGGNVDNKWKVINFAPCYNGAPSDNFSADVGLARPSVFGLPTSDGEGHDAANTNGYALFNLPEEMDEWAVKDLRSYLQRPVFSMRALFAALEKPANSSGYLVDLSALKDFPYAKAWMTLPMLSSRSIPSSGETINLTASIVPVTNDDEQFTVTFSHNVEILSGANTDVNVSVSVEYMMQEPEDGVYPDILYTWCEPDEIGIYWQFRIRVIFMQAVAYDENGNAMGGSTVKTYYHYGGDVASIKTPEGMAEAVKFTPWYAASSYEPSYRDAHFVHNMPGSRFYTLSESSDFQFQIAGAVKEVKVYLSTYTVITNELDENVMTYSKGFIYGWLFSNTKKDASKWSCFNAGEMPTGEHGQLNVITGNIRSGAVITKKIVLSTEHTPADYLLSFCKMFGFLLIYDSVNKSIRAVKRQDFFRGDLETIDLTERIDTSQGVTIEPFVFDSKWYEFKLDGSGGAFEEMYSQIYGRDYGAFRIDTGYDFDDRTTDLLSGNVFRGAAMVLKQSRYMLDLFRDNTPIPAPFISRGNSYTLYNATGEGADISIPSIGTRYDFFNPSNNGYDYSTSPRPQFEDEDGSPVDGDGVLLLRSSISRTSRSYYKLSDDIPEMDTLNNGVPCWLLEPGSETGISVPNYSRFNQPVIATASLDFGIPAELGIPRTFIADTAPVFAQAWRTYLRDRYDVNTKVMRCRADLSGMQVGQELLGRFFWYDGAIWVINSIGNYSVTTYDTCELELVQVQDISNYTSGQYE